MLSSKLLKQIFFILILVLLGIFIIQNLLDLLNAMLGAVLLYILSIKPVAFLEQKGFKSKTAEWIFLLTTLLFIAIPLGILIWVIERNHTHIYSSFLAYKDSFEGLKHTLSQRFGINILSGDMLKTLVAKISAMAPGMLNASFSTISSVGIMFILFFFLLTGDEGIKKEIGFFLPLNEKNKKTLFEKMYASILSNAIMVPLVALFQAFIGWISYAIAGVSNSFIWFLATFFASMLPLVGGALIYIPLSMILYFSGQENQGIFVLIWGLVVMSSSDNFLRIFFSKHFDDTHPLITFLGVILGLNVFGFLGLIYGPLLLSIFFILIGMYRAEYKT